MRVAYVSFFLYAVLMILSPGCSASSLVGICLAVCALYAGPCVAEASIQFSSLWVSASGAWTYALRVTEMPSKGIIPSVCVTGGGAHLPGLCLMLQPSWWALFCMSLHLMLQPSWWALVLYVSACCSCVSWRAAATLLLCSVSSMP